MSNDAIEIIDKKLEDLINDKTQYTFTALQTKVEEILKNEAIFMVDNQLNSKAADMYLKTVITKRNALKKIEEDLLLKKEDKASKYELIESICKKLEFETKDELIKKVEELEKKRLLELYTINNSL